jgi:hypothetical protein
MGGCTSNSSVRWFCGAAMSTGAYTSVEKIDITTSGTRRSRRMIRMVRGPACPVTSTSCPVTGPACPVTRTRDVSLEAQRARKRRNSKAARAAQARPVPPDINYTGRTIPAPRRAHIWSGSTTRSLRSGRWRLFCSTRCNEGTKAGDQREDDDRCRARG